jgi:hypothetical protein
MPFMEDLLWNNDWNPKDDCLLHDAILRKGSNDWLAIVEEIPHKSPYECKARWKSILLSGKIHGNWCPEEDRIIACMANNVSVMAMS